MDGTERAERIGNAFKEQRFAVVHDALTSERAESLVAGVWASLEQESEGKVQRRDPLTWRDSHWPLAARSQGRVKLDGMKKLIEEVFSRSGAVANAFQTFGNDDADAALEAWCSHAILQRPPSLAAAERARRGDRAVDTARPTAENERRDDVRRAVDHESWLTSSRAWMHFDQHPSRAARMEGVQGAICLSTGGGRWCHAPGSHLNAEAWAARYPGVCRTARRRDGSERGVFIPRGDPMEAGAVVTHVPRLSLVVWDSRIAHGFPPNTIGDTPAIWLLVAMLPLAARVNECPCTTYAAQTMAFDFAGNSASSIATASAAASAAAPAVAAAVSATAAVASGRGASQRPLARRPPAAAAEAAAAAQQRGAFLRSSACTAAHTTTTTTTTTRKALIEAASLFPVAKAAVKQREIDTYREVGDDRSCTPSMVQHRVQLSPHSTLPPLLRSSSSLPSHFAHTHTHTHARARTFILPFPSPTTTQLTLTDRSVCAVVVMTARRRWRSTGLKASTYQWACQARWLRRATWCCACCATRRTRTSGVALASPLRTAALVTEVAWSALLVSPARIANT